MHSRAQPQLGFASAHATSSLQQLLFVHDRHAASFVSLWQACGPPLPPLPPPASAPAEPEPAEALPLWPELVPPESFVSLEESLLSEQLARARTQEAATPKRTRDVLNRTGISPSSLPIRGLG
jgi:hypothetical protein